jgi:galactonate dehydratase
LDGPGEGRDEVLAERAIRFSPLAPDYHLRKSFEEWVSEAERRAGVVREALQGDAEFHPYFHEDPMGDVQARSGLPVATGERFSSIFRFRGRYCKVQIL